MKENLVNYNHNFFKENWSKLCDIKIGYNNIPNFIKEILKDYYEPKNKWKDDNSYIKGGVFNTGHPHDNKGRSLLNYLNTNYTSLTILINNINQLIVNKEIKEYTQIDFYLSSWRNEIEKLFNIIKDYKNEIFDNNSPILNKILKKIKETSNFGDKIEKITIEKLKKFPGIEDIKQAEFGHVDDMFKGIDIQFRYRGKIWTVQCKSFSNIKLENDIYIISGVSHAKDYKFIDLYAFYNPQKGFYMFNNKNIKRIVNTYYINKNYKKNI